VRGVSSSSAKVHTRLGLTLTTLILVADPCFDVRLHFHPRPSWFMRNRHLGASGVADPTPLVGQESCLPRYALSSGDVLEKTLMEAVKHH
jgi:hypothetical protein